MVLFVLCRRNTDEADTFGVFAAEPTRYIRQAAAATPLRAGDAADDGIRSGL